MGLQSALSTALTGLNAAETIIDVAGNNVANSQTVGFKESDVSFATQFNQTLSIGAAPSDQSGGTNPRQLGLGVKVSEIAPDFTQGTIEISSNPLDVAIQGDGFLLVQGSQGELLYTRNGQLSTNQDNEVVTTQGQRVLGFNATDGEIIEALQPITIPIGGSQVNRVTETATFSGNLSPQAEPGQGGVITSEVFGNADIEEPNDDNFTIANIQTTPLIDVSSVSGAAVGGGNPAAGTYDYVVTFSDSTNPSIETAASSPIRIDSGATAGPIDLSGLPLPTGDYDTRNIYRTIQGGTGSYSLVGSQTNPADGTFQDTVADGSLGAALNNDALDLGAYSYYVTFYSNSELYESIPTAEIGTRSVTLTNQRIRIEDIPQPEPGSVFDEIRIYRNDGSGVHRRVAELLVGQEVFMDSVANADLGAEIDLDGARILASEPLINLQVRSGSTYSTPFGEPGVISFTGSKGVIDLAPKELVVTNNTTVQEWIDFMNQSLGIDRTIDNPPSSTLVDGVLSIESNIGIENFATIDQNAFTFTPDATGLAQSVVLDFAESTSNPPVGEGTSTDFVVYDSLGIPLSVRLTTVLESTDGNNTFYRWFATSPDNEVSATNVDTVVGSGVLTFDGQGDLVSTGGSTNVTISRTLTASNSPLSFDLDFDSVSGLNITDNLGNSTSTMNFLAQDGFPPGVLTNFAITEGGEIRGVYSNGIEETLAQMRMARFTNNEGLQQVGNNLFAEGVNSGEPQFGNPGDSGIGSLTAGAVELSNTDVGQNLVDLILASTQYRGGARVITAVQELLDELMALQR
ncbi:MAG: flagellar hook-basal body complex protein [Planctomycetota bacterium]